MAQTTNSTTKRPRFSYGEKWVPLILLLLTILTYLPLIKTLGFYWDDWPMLWFDVTQGPAGFAEAFTSDRPFLGYLYQATGAIVGSDPLNWQLVTVLFRWLISCAFFWMVRQLWPKFSEAGFWAAAMLTVYSGFKQMPIAYVWGNALIMLFAYILSYAIMLKAIAAWESGRKRTFILWTVPAVLLYTFCTVSTEYYTGLDLVRGIILWIFLSHYESFRKLPFGRKILKTLLHWLPYLLPLGIFMFWRVFIFQFPSYQPVLLTELAANPLKAILNVALRAVKDAYTASWGAWTEFFSFPAIEQFATVAGKIFWAFVLAGLVFSLAALFRFKTSYQTRDALSPEQTRSRAVTEMILLGLAAIILPGIPYWVTSLSPSLEFPKERWLSAYMFGSCILMVGLILLFIRGRSLQILVTSLFIAMAVGGNILNANRFRRDWQNQREFINQLSVRIPDFEAPMYLLTDFNPLAYETDNSLTGMVNLALAPESSALTLPVSVGFYDVRFKSSNERLKAGDFIYQGFRSANFQGAISDVVVYFYSPPGCLRVLDPQQHSTLPIFPQTFYEFIEFSNPEKILPTGNRPLMVQEQIFKQPIEKNWCYYFETADLARQQQDWQTIAAIGDETLSKFNAGEASEYILFVEAYATLGRWQDAIPLIGKIHQMNPSLDGPVCPILQELFTANLPEDPEMIDQVARALIQIGCNAYSR